MIQNKLVVPFVKWAGGKRQLLPEIINLMPDKYSTYYEPFVGGGAVIFALQPAKAVINDANTELVNVYTVIKNSLEELLDDLKTHKNEAEYFYKIRSLDKEPEYANISRIQRASRIIYLNKTCFNGLYRVNKSGKFNTPFGRYINPNFVNEVTLRAVSLYLNNNDINITNLDYIDSLNTIDSNAFVYLDPPYHPLSSSSSFTGYTMGQFDLHDQIQLRDICNKLHARGIRFLLSNSATQFIEDLYADYHISYVKASRAINSIGAKRGQINEVLIRNYL
jgi:DNA adenine methylase